MTNCANGGLGAPSHFPPGDDLAGGVDILIVDDHVDSLRALRLILSAEGHRVAVATDIASARVLVGDAVVNRFDLLLTDITLPDGDGRSLLAELRAANPAARGAVLSGRSADDERDQCLADGFEWLLAKPVQIDELIAIAASVAAARGRC